MTASEAKEISAGKRHSFGLVAVVISMTVLSLFFSESIKEYARDGLLLCARSILPTLFPFMFFSDLLVSVYDGNGKGALSFLFEKIFGLSAIAVLPFVCGTLCGFPLGAVCVGNLYRAGMFDREDAEYLVGLSSAPSLAFIISGVGVGMLNSSYLGVMLFLSVIISSLITGVIFRTKERKIKISREIKRQKFDFAESIKRAGFSSLTICAFITFFSVAAGLIGEVVKNKIILAFLTSLLEIGNASSFISSELSASPILMLSMLGFALGFSGLSVYMQTRSVVSDIKFSGRKYLKMKLVQGVLSALIMLAFGAFCF